LHLALGGIEFRFAGGRQAYALFEEFQRLFQGQVALFQLIDDCFFNDSSNEGIRITHSLQGFQNTRFGVGGGLHARR